MQPERFAQDIGHRDDGIGFVYVAVNRPCENLRVVLGAGNDAVGNAVWDGWHGGSFRPRTVTLRNTYAARRKPRPTGLPATAAVPRSPMAGREPRIQPILKPRTYGGCRLLCAPGSRAREGRG